MSTEQERPASLRQPVLGRFLWIILATGILASLAAALYFGLIHKTQNGATSTARDPRLDYTGPFRNVNPAVAYVSDDRCAACHVKEAHSFAQHPMGRSLVPVERAPAPPIEAASHNPFESLGSRFRIEKKDGHVWHLRQILGADGRMVAEQKWDVRFVVGSGTRGYSYLDVRDGFLFETPISWYSQKQVWDLSPGFDRMQLNGRTIAPDCLYCHANRSHPLEDARNHYEEPIFDGFAIGCQRCHGPGALHVSKRENGEIMGEKPDYTIVNPRHLEPKLRDAVCEQCHLQGKQRLPTRGRGVDDFRPGMPLELFWSVLMSNTPIDGAMKAVGQVEQMYESRCFQLGDGRARLGCTSCHDPHVQVPAGERITHYRQSCLQCHEKRGCRLPPAERIKQSPQDSCVDCHMPRYGSADIPHTASTDHRILRSGVAVPNKPVVAAPKENLPFNSFYHSHLSQNQFEEERAIAIATVSIARVGDPAGLKALREALPLLRSAVERDDSDLVGLEAFGYALGMLNRESESLSAFEKVLMKAPARAQALAGAAAMAEVIGQNEGALDYWRRATKSSPWEADYRRRFVSLMIKTAAWNEGLTQSAEWMRVDPSSAEARTARVTCLLALDKKEAARAEFAQIEALAPPNFQELRIRFEKKLK
jgi:hypothetical protein